LKIQKWTRSTGKVANPCLSIDMDWRKDLHGNFLYFNKQSFSVLGKRIATQQAVLRYVKKGKKTNLFIKKTINSSFCSD
jgi:hypothetical protein